MLQRSLKETLKRKKFGCAIRSVIMHCNFKAAVTILMSHYLVEKNQTKLLLRFVGTSPFSELFLGNTKDAMKVVNHLNFTTSFVESRKISFHPYLGCFRVFPNHDCDELHFRDFFSRDSHSRNVLPRNSFLEPLKVILLKCQFYSLGFCVGPLLHA